MRIERSGKPKICVPIMAKTLSQLELAIETINSHEGIDFVEWRVDYYQEAIPQALALYQTTLTKPLIFTFRTEEEGGEAAITMEAYTDLLRMAYHHAAVDYIDVELNRPVDHKAIVKAAHQYQTQVIVSYHNFNHTPIQADLLDVFRRQAATKADVLKLAVMPHHKSDVLSLMDSVLKIKAELNMPIIAMAMGRLGTISRVSGQWFGSSLTFATLKEQSAPGQLSVDVAIDLINHLSEVDPS